MTYTWTNEQRRGLTFGSTVECRAVRDASLADIGRVRFEGDKEYRYLNLLDPSTLRPPSIEWIRELASERLGADAYVIDERFVLDVSWSDSRYAMNVEDTPSLDRFRAAVAAIVAISNAGLGK